MPEVSWKPSPRELREFTQAQEVGPWPVRDPSGSSVSLAHERSGAGHPLHLLSRRRTRHAGAVMDRVLRVGTGHVPLKLWDPGLSEIHSFNAELFIGLNGNKGLCPTNGIILL